MGTAGGDPEDSFAILLALHSPELEVAGLTVVQGNVPVDHGYANAVHLLELLGRRDVPVCRAPRVRWIPAGARRSPGSNRAVALERLVPPVTPPQGDPGAVEFLVQSILERPGEITLVTIGPLSNVAAALGREPALAAKIPRIVMMAGAATCRETSRRLPSSTSGRTPKRPRASSKRASRSRCWGSTSASRPSCTKTECDVSLPLRPSWPASWRAPSQPWIEVRRAVFGASDLHLYDSLAVAAAFRPALVRTQPAFVAVETAGVHTAGATVAHLNPILRAALAKREPNADVALEVDADAFEALFPRG